MYIISHTYAHSLITPQLSRKEYFFSSDLVHLCKRRIFIDISLGNLDSTFFFRTQRRTFSIEGRKNRACAQANFTGMSAKFGFERNPNRPEAGEHKTRRDGSGTPVLERSQLVVTSRAISSVGASSAREWWGQPPPRCHVI